MTACFTSTSFANRLSARSFLWDPKSWELLGSVVSTTLAGHGATAGRLWTVLSAVPKLRPHTSLLLKPSKSTWLASSLQTDAAVISRLRTLTTDFFGPQIQALDVTVRQMLKYQVWLYEGLMYTICYPCAVCASGRNEFLGVRAFCYFIFWNFLGDKDISSVRSWSLP